MSDFVKPVFRAGIDVGSTTVKLVVLDEHNRSLYSEYRRHQAHTQETLAELLSEAKETIGDCDLKVSITGSGSINLAKALNITFVQEVVAVADALKTNYPKTDVAIELGGEDAKIIYFTGGLEERMNGVCAGGTGSFIDQMAALLQTDAGGLNEAAKDYHELYNIAARCGVFAKTDIQPLINEGARREDLAASIFQAVVNQTISGLACGKPIRGCVAFLGGPLHFLPELKKAFIRTLHLSPENVVDPEDSHLFAAVGAALNSGEEESHPIDELIGTLEKGVKMDFEIKRLPALFEDEADYDRFLARHAKAVVGKGDIASYTGDCFLGVDAGSTTTKLALIGEEGELLYSFYANNKGNPIQTAKEAMAEIESLLPESAQIVRSCSTGYGEALLKAAFSLDEGEVETIAHETAAEFFDPAVDCVLDIGGQDMKCIRLRNHTVDNVLLNEACSSGCGSFIENFATSLGYTAAEFAKEALYARNPVDLGTRCTVFMNSNVKQAQKEGADVSDISAGLAYSVIKNALYKVIKLADAHDLGQHIVVQGGTFYNHAVLRAFEKISDVEVTCPDISGIMGAFGAALIARDHYRGQQTTMLSFDEIRDFSYTTRTSHCGGCENNCMLTINTFPGGSRYITGNRCEKVVNNERHKEKGPNLYEYKMERLFGYEPLKEEEAPYGVIGIPRVLNMYENYPYWFTFFTDLGFSVKLSPFSKRRIYELGMESIPSESECYPAKLAHGHVQWLINEGVRTIFHPAVLYEHQDFTTQQNHYNCPIVVSYPENLKNNVEDVINGDVDYIRPFIAFTSEKTAENRLIDVCRKEWGIPADKVKKAARHAWDEQRKAKADIRKKGEETLAWMEKEGRRGIVLAGRPYHVDPEINHGIPELIASYGLAVFSEDSLP
ncbi:MAG: 2-hydroxyglutaryl-CoA dehydratase, partial [Lachnospiraceae bacterium]|nr:2-hydroxyglutaryl-CoA dehydratase [Lachnospiraceae bacterium]